ncbi:hypothetical protein GCM10022214_80390 [Actinomadura miaoliensis]|uniref:aldehyde dehydrogenase (NAD(+)) n=1 Tax=Actinomadura miaoliensis TaxID=430685 RepID=A0ABP7X1M1_9ACTN
MMIVTEDADVQAAIATVPAQSLANNGQICSNLTRIIAHRDVYADVLDALDSVFDRLTVGDPTDPATDIGPLAFEAQLDRAAAHIAQAIGEGATLRRGGTIFCRDGHYLQPGILTTDDPRNHAFQTEIFAPVVTVTPYTGDDHAIELANATPYGLDGCIWTADPGPRPAHDLPDSLRHRPRQRRRAARARPARRLQTVRHRPEARPRGPGRLPGDQGRRRSEVVRLTLAGPLRSAQAIPAPRRDRGGQPVRHRFAPAGLAGCGISARRRA